MVVVSLLQMRPPMRILFAVTTLVCTLLLGTCGEPESPAGPRPREEGRIRPWPQNPRYWEYKGEAVLLLGGTADDNLFQWPRDRLVEHLDLLAAAGGNYVRNTMSDRDEGNLHAFHRGEDGLYDLERWNDRYWERFETFLDETDKRDIIVQIEVWDRFDHAREPWLSDPFRPSNNLNYTPRQAGLDNDYPDHPSRDKQPFFHSIPGIEQYEKRLDLVRRFQERFVDKLLSYSLAYPHVLYCMNNETSTDPAWGRYWMQFIRAKAVRHGAEVYVTDMFDDGWKPEQSAKLRQVFDSPSLYAYIDISQVNSRNFGEDHWNRLRWVIEQVDAAGPRPVNHVKIYGSGETSWGSGTPADGVERFWRNLLAGSASARFHRNGSGLGLTETAQASIRAARRVESLVKFWTLQPRPGLLKDREEDEAYLAARPGEAYVLYFTDGGSITLDLSDSEGDYSLQRISIETGEASGEETVTGGDAVPMEASAGPWVIVVARRPD